MRSWTGQVFLGVSVDGFIARADGELNWLSDPPPGPEHVAITSSVPVAGYDAFIADIDNLVMGRGTYEKVLTFGFWPYEGRAVTVLSSTLETDDDRITVARDLDAVLARLAETGARQVYVDGGKVVQTFLRHDLVDRLTISWAPVLIGSGIPLFGELDRDVRLRLIASNATETGMVAATYEVYRD